MRFFCLLNEELFIQLIEEENPDGCIFTYTGFHPHMISNTNYAYVKKYNNLVNDVQEKQPFTNNPMNEEASSGSYYFKSGSLMKKYFEKTLDSDLKVNDEYYVSMVYKIMIDEKRKVNTFKINYFMQWGTPSDLEEYLWYSNLFTSLINHQKNIKPFHKGSLLMPMAGEGKRFQEKGFNITKPLIEVSGKAMFKQALDDLPYTDFSHLVIRKDKFSQYKINELQKETKNLNLLTVDKPTLGQADTCLRANSYIDENNPLTISACDMGIIFDYKKFNELMENEKVDIIVWGCRGYPGAIKNPNIYGWIIEENKSVKKISVKKNLNNPKIDPCVIGTFTFKKASYFKNSAEMLIKRKKTVNNEYYVDSCIDEAISLGLNVVLLEVDFSYAGAPLMI